MSMTASKAMRNHLVMVAIILTITSMVPTPCISSKASTDRVWVAMHKSRRPHTLRPEIMAPNQDHTADRNKDAATTTTTITGSRFQEVGKEDLLNLQQQLAHERQNHPRVMLARKAFMRPTPRAIAAGRLSKAASSSLAADCDAVAVATTGSYRSWRAQWLRAGYMFKLHPMQLFFYCTKTTKISKAAAKNTQNSHGVIPVVRSRRALKHLSPAPPLAIPPLPFTIPPLPFTIPSPPRLTFPPFLPPPITIPSPPGLTFPPLLPPSITFPPLPVTFPPVPPLPLSSFTPPPAVQKASISMP